MPNRIAPCAPETGAASLRVLPAPAANANAPTKSSRARSSESSSDAPGGFDEALRGARKKETPAEPDPKAKEKTDRADATPPKSKSRKPRAAKRENASGVASEPSAEADQTTDADVADAQDASTQKPSAPTDDADHTDDAVAAVVDEEPEKHETQQSKVVVQSVETPQTAPVTPQEKGDSQHHDAPVAAEAHPEADASAAIAASGAVQVQHAQQTPEDGNVSVDGDQVAQATDATSEVDQALSVNRATSSAKPSVRATQPSGPRQVAIQPETPGPDAAKSTEANVVPPTAFDSATSVEELEPDASAPDSAHHESSTVLPDAIGASAIENLAPQTTKPLQAESAAHAPAQPAPAPEVRFAEDNHPSIVAGVRGQLLPSGGTMHLRLDPPELGPLQVTVHLRNGVMEASFETSTDEAAKLLSHSLSTLKTSLESQGVNVEKLHVQQAPKSEQTNQNGSDRDQQAQNRDPEQQQNAQREHQRREMLRRMWRRLSGAQDPLDMVA